MEIKLETSAAGADPVQVWVVDDSNQIRRLIAETLERHGSITCTRQFECPNGLLSTLASRTGPDVILLDIQMGELNGIDALPAIKSLARDTRVFMLTTFLDLGWQRLAMESGASGYFLKGASMERLVESIRDRSLVPPPRRRRRRRPTCTVLQSQAAAAGNPQDSMVASPSNPRRATDTLLGWFKRFARG